MTDHSKKKNQKVGIGENVEKPERTLVHSWREYKKEHNMVYHRP